MIVIFEIRKQFSRESRKRNFQSDQKHLFSKVGYDHRDPVDEARPICLTCPARCCNQVKADSVHTIFRWAFSPMQRGRGCAWDDEYKWTRQVHSRCVSTSWRCIMMSPWLSSHSRGSHGCPKGEAVGGPHRPTRSTMTQRRPHGHDTTAQSSHGGGAVGHTVPWQHQASSRVDRQFRDGDFFARFDDSANALTRCRITRLELHLFRVLPLRRFRLSMRTCRCGLQLDVCGHHRAGCAAARVLGRREHALESAAPHICPLDSAQCNGARLRFWRCQMQLTDGQRVEVVVDGLPLFRRVREGS